MNRQPILGEVLYRTLLTGLAALGVVCVLAIMADWQVYKTEYRRELERQLNKLPCAALGIRG